MINKLIRNQVYDQMSEHFCQRVIYKIWSQIDGYENIAFNKTRVWDVKNQIADQIWNQVGSHIRFHLANPYREQE